MSAELIDFTTRLRTPGVDEPPRRPTGLTTTAKNQRLRRERWEVWRKAEATTKYWHALLRFTRAVGCAKRHDVKEAREYPKTSGQADLEIVKAYRVAIGQQLLTPAHDVASVNWKRRHWRKPYLEIDEDSIAKAIAEDISWLDSHPTGTSRSNKLRAKAKAMHTPRPQPA